MARNHLGRRNFPRVRQRTSGIPRRRRSGSSVRDEWSSRWTDEQLTGGPGIILGRKGAYRGIHYSKHPFFVIDTAYYVQPKSDLDIRWLYYSMIYNQLGSIDDGSPIPSTRRAAVYVQKLKIPDKDTQTAISKILGDLDDKIDLLRQMNRTLEQITRAVFQAWFVDFEPVRARRLAPQAFEASPKRSLIATRNVRVLPDRRHSGGVDH